MMLRSPIHLQRKVVLNQSNWFDLALAWASLFKLRIVALLLFVALASAFVAGSGRVQLVDVAILIATGVMAASGAGAINHYVERRVDAVMSRTSNRPLPSGRVRQQKVVLVVGLCLITLAALVAVPFKPWLAFFSSLGALVYDVIYTVWLKHRTRWNVVVGGAAGACAVLGGWAAVDAEWWAPLPLLLSIMVFLWTPPHFWSLAIVHCEDYRMARVPMLPAVVGQRGAALWSLGHVVALVAVSLVPAVIGALNQIYLVLSATAALTFLITATRLLFAPCVRNARGHFRMSMVYIAVVFAAAVLDVAL